MKNKTFLKILFIVVIFAMGIYIVIPKYDYIDDQTPDLVRFNKITGNLEVCKDGQNWYRVVSKSIVKVEKPTITYEEFMQGREKSQGFFSKIEKTLKEK